MNANLIADCVVLARQTADSAGVPWWRVVSRQQSREVVGVRRAIARRLRTETALTLKQIATILGRGDHTTILAYVRDAK